jgi:3-oxoacyl-[acyl-carrier-protein] synthase II
MSKMASSSRRRVVITGMGAVTSLGNDVQSIWEAVLEGRSGIRRISQFDSKDFPIKIGSEVDLKPLLLEGVDDIAPHLSRSARFGLWSLDHAWRNARLEDDEIDPWRAGICIGASSFPTIEDSMADLMELDDPHQILTGNFYNVDYYLKWCERRPELLSQRDMPMISALLSHRYKLRGVSMTVQTACASATQAIGESYQMIAHNRADLMVTGGTDSMITIICLTGFTLLGALSANQGDPTKVSRPFDLKRDGFVIGEGAGVVILEELQQALRRGAPIYAEVIGYGSSSDGYRFTDIHPQGTGAVTSMQAALSDAGIEPNDVDYINAHGTSTYQNDRIETMALKQVFGDHAYRLAISSTKSQLGHLICAAGGIELIFTALAVQNGILPPTINHERPDPDCDLDYVSNQCRRADARIAMSNSFGFGGQNGSLIVRRWEKRQTENAN